MTTEQVNVIPCRCLRGELAEPSALREHPKNPNKHSKEQIRLLVKSVRHHGWRWPVIISNLSGFVVAGHARVKAAIEIGCAVPVCYQDFDSEADEIAFMLADNRLAELADLQQAEADAILVELDANMGVQDIEITGYSDGYLKAICERAEAGIVTDKETDSVRTCPACGFEL